MSGTTKKTCTNIAVNHKIAERSSKQTSLKKGYWTIKNENDASNIFMITDYLKRYYQTHPRSTTGLIPDEAACAGNLEWLNMSDIEKGHWIEKAKKMKAEGETLRSIRIAAYANYPPKDR